MSKEEESVYLSELDVHQLVNTYGHGDLTRSDILFFGIEEGLNGLGIQDALKTRFDMRDKLGTDGTVCWYKNEEELADVNLRSDFLTYTARLILSLKNQNEPWFDIGFGREDVHTFLSKSMYREFEGLHTALIDWKPLPKANISHWPYANIVKRDYNRVMALGKKVMRDIESSCTDGYYPWVTARLNGMGHILKEYHPRILIGVGDATKKRHILSVVIVRTFGVVPVWKTMHTRSGKTFTTTTIKTGTKETNIVLAPFFSRRTNCLTMAGLEELSQLIVEMDVI